MTRIVIADDHAFLRAGLEQVLASMGHDIVASVGDGDAAVVAIADTRPDMAIIDIRMPGRDGASVLNALREAGDQTPVLILTAELDDSALVSLMRAGVNGILFKDADAGAMRHAINKILTGERAIAMELMERAFALVSAPAAPDPFAGLSERDRKIVEGAATGLRNREIAGNLSISEGSVKVYLHRIFDRLNVSNRTELALLVRDSLPGKEKA